MSMYKEEKMSWQYSDPLSSALMAAAGTTNGVGGVKATAGSGSEIGLGSNSLYRQYYSNYDPLISRYETRRQQNLYRPTHADLLDEIDDLALEMEAENLFASSRRTNISSTYVPTATTNTSLFLSQNSLVDHVDKATGTSFIEDEEKRTTRKRQQQQQQQQAEINHKASQIPKQPPPKTNKSNKTNGHHNTNNTEKKQINQQVKKINNNKTKFSKKI